jgi:hypothetical protein
MALSLSETLYLANPRSYEKATARDDKAKTANSSAPKSFVCAPFAEGGRGSYA